MPIRPNAPSTVAELISAVFAADNAAPPCFYWSRCRRRAELEKAGRSVCRLCSASLRGTEYPQRNPSIEPLYASARTAAEALDMLEPSSDDLDIHSSRERNR